MWERGAGKSACGVALQTSQVFFSFSGGATVAATVAVVVGDVMSEAAEVASTLAGEVQNTNHTSNTELRSYS